MKKILYLIAIFCISEIGYSQSDLREGFIINHNQDTTFGQIKYKEGSTTYRNCQFKASDSQNIILYKPDEIIGYGFKNDKYFQSIKIETSDQNSEFLFLEVLIRGKVSLFRYENVYYVEKAEQGLLKLTNKVESTIDGEKVTNETKSYVGVLNLFLSDSPEISQSKIFQTNFNEKSITNLIELYNKSMNSTMVIYKLGKPWVRTRIGITGGLISSQIALEANNGLLDHLGPFKRSNSAVFGATFEILSPRINENVSLLADFMISNSKYDSHNQRELGGKKTKNFVTIELTHLKVPIGFRYTFRNGRNLSSYINLGLSENFVISSKTDWTQTVEYITLFDTYHDEALEISKTQLGVWGGAGIKKSISKWLDIYTEFRYERTEGINASNYVAMKKSNVTSFQVTIGLTTK